MMNFLTVPYRKLIESTILNLQLKGMLRALRVIRMLPRLLQLRGLQELSLRRQERISKLRNSERSTI